MYAEDTRQIAIKAKGKDILINVHSHVVIEGIDLFATDYLPGYYGGLYANRNSNAFKLNDKGYPNWTDDPCMVFYNGMVCPFMGVCFYQCPTCMMRMVLSNAQYRKKGLALYRESAVINAKLPIEPHSLYLQSSFDPFNPKIPKWMRDSNFELMAKNDHHFWFNHTRAPETFVERFMSGHRWPTHYKLGISLESDHNIAGHGRATSIEARLKNIEILAKETDIDLFVSVAPFFTLNDPKQFSKTLYNCGVRKITVCRNQLINTDSDNEWSAKSFLWELSELGIPAYVNSYSIDKWGLDTMGADTPEYITYVHPRAKEFYEIK